MNDKQTIVEETEINTKKDYWSEFGGSEKAANIFSSELSLRIRLGDLFDETKVDTWLHKPNKAFDNKRPIDLIREGNTAPIYKMIYIMESGEPLS